MTAEYIFYNSVGRLRSGWRVLLFSILYLVLCALALFTLLNLKLENSSFASLTVTFSIFSAITIFLGWFCGRLFEDLPFHALGCWFSKNWAKDLLLGLLGGGIAMLIAALIAFAFGGLKFEMNQTAAGAAIFNTLGTTLLIFIFGAISEETLFRGYVLQTLFRAKLQWPAIIATSLFFSLGHFNNPNIGNIAKINTVLAGIWFSVAYLKTRSLWFPFGLHFMWNWIQGSVLGIPVSGLDELTPAPLLHADNLGPIWLTGGKYGLEGGIACTIIIILASVLIWFMPFLKPDEELLNLTSHEIPKIL